MLVEWDKSKKLKAKYAEPKVKTKNIRYIHLWPVSPWPIRLYDSIRTSLVRTLRNRI